jgi:RND family efflux transporter MFP subunit
LSLTTVAAAQTPVENPTVATVDHCMVSLEPISGQSQVPAQEAGVLKNIKVREGQQVKTGDLLVQIDDAQAQEQLKNARAEYRAAEVKAKNDIELRYARKAADVAEFTYLKQKQSADKVPGAVTEVDLQKYKLDWEKSLLQIEQAQKNQIVDGYTAESKKAETGLAEENIRRRQILAPIDGIVQQIDRSLGEWVKPGDSVLRLLRMDRLTVEGSLKYSDYEPAQVANQPVTADVDLAHGRKAQFSGKIVFVDPEVLAGNYKVRAEVANRKENGEWLLRPGAHATMTIQLTGQGQLSAQ